MFITEAQLALYKYQANSRYFKESMSYIAKSEFFEFAKFSQKNLNVVDCFAHFWTRRLDSNSWEVSFSDGSILLIRFVKENDEEGYYLHCSSDRINWDRVFSD